MNARDEVLTAANLRVARLADVSAACDRCGANIFQLVLQDIIDVAYSLTEEEAERRLVRLERKLLAVSVSTEAVTELSRAVSAYREAVNEWAEKVGLLIKERGDRWQG